MTVESEHDDSEADSQSEPESKQAAEQQRLLAEYIKQQRRRACPGCGEEPFLG